MTKLFFLFLALQGAKCLFLFKLQQQKLERDTARLHIKIKKKEKGARHCSGSHVNINALDLETGAILVVVDEGVHDGHGLGRDADVEV